MKKKKNIGAENAINNVSLQILFALFQHEVLSLPFENFLPKWIRLKIILYSGKLVEKNLANFSSFAFKKT